MNTILKNTICCLLIILLLNLVLKTYEQFSIIKINHIIEIGEKGNTGPEGDCDCNDLTSETIMENINKLDSDIFNSKIKEIIQDKNHFIDIYKEFMINYN